MPKKTTAQLQQLERDLEDARRRVLDYVQLCRQPDHSADLKLKLRTSALEAWERLARGLRGWLR
jgi:hypothetical protein